MGCCDYRGRALCFGACGSYFIENKGYNLSVDNYLSFFVDDPDFKCGILMPCKDRVQLVVLCGGDLTRLCS